MNKRLRFIALNLVLVSLLAGCATMKLINPKNAKWKSQKFSSELPVGWVKYSAPGNQLTLTRDGAFLQYISISKTKTNKELQNTKKKITEDLLIQELADIIQNEISLTSGVGGFEVISKKPADIDGLEAFRLEYKYQNKELVDYQGVIYGFIFNKKYYEIGYSAMKQHYHAKSIAAFEDFVKKFRVKQNL
ncbi:MAG: DUF1795 domain-containing protein [Candidatus Omnitrophica bacterium]|nr:DUF1795 domain-containing protein [Candidatus Omnitrophota bacterium]MBU1995996.1 DUF1795 domain-containing protein [Candidatus Omnitrophota bacterium]